MVDVEEIVNDPENVNDEDLLGQVMTSTLQKMLADPGNRDSYLKAFRMILDVDTSGIPDNMKTMLMHYMELKETLVKKNDIVE